MPRRVKARQASRRVASRVASTTSPRTAKGRKPARDNPSAALTPVEVAEQRFNITPKLVAHMLRQQNGLLTATAKKLGMPHATLHRYIKAVPECREAAEEAREAMGDIAESKLFELIRQGDVRCLLYYLSTVHRNRGYGLRPGESPFNPQENRPVFVETVTVIGIPSGTFLPNPGEPPTIDN